MPTRLARTRQPDNWRQCLRSGKAQAVSADDCKQAKTDHRQRIGDVRGDCQAEVLHAKSGLNRNVLKIGWYAVLSRK
ncbi:MAG: hypothetical protein OXI60_07715 [Acidiferrobacterales bacterium]|nr:hypothetical protein [Acidiferrobacterales bacterium]